MKIIMNNGKETEVTQKLADALVKMGKAMYAEEKTVEEDKPKRQYKRKDMTPEGE